MIHGFWRKDRLGQYTVKSAYASIQDSVVVNQTSSNSGFWNKLWNLKIPLKVKHFIWREIRDCLPTKDRLINRRVEVNSLCPVCNLVKETIFHAVVSCHTAALYWQYLEYTYDVSTVVSLEGWIAEVLQHSRRNTVNKIFMVEWAMWNNKNDIAWKQRGKGHIDIVASAVQVLNNWESAQDRSFENSFGFITQTDGDVRWTQPMEGTVKVNTDAALFEESNRYSFAMVARDHDGQMLAARSCCRQGSINPELAEAVGIREALSWVKDKGWPRAVVESDCLGAIQAIRCSSINLSYFGRVVDECKKLLAELESRNVTLKFVKRSANMVAHYIARYSSSLADHSWGMGDVHPDLIYVLLNDLKV